MRKKDKNYKICYMIKYKIKISLFLEKNINKTTELT